MATRSFGQPEDENLFKQKHQQSISFDDPETGFSS